VNGIIYTQQSIGDDFVPEASLNPRSRGIARVTISAEVRVAVYTADEARRYAAAFTEAAELLDRQAATPDPGGAA
jgi:hypothetical protein